MFQGFSEQTIDFLWGIRLNNSRAWFQEHKQIYLDELYQPLKELGEALLAGMRAAFPEDEMILKVARIYRDARRVKYGGLYKDHLWLGIRCPGEEESTRPSFYFEISPEGYEYGMGYYALRPVQMEQYRRRIARQPEELTRLAEQMAGQSRFTLGGESYKRPKGDMGPLLNDWYNRKNVYLFSMNAPNERMLTPQLKDDVLDGFRWLMPYYRYFKALELEPPVTDRF